MQSMHKNSLFFPQVIDVQPSDCAMWQFGSISLVWTPRKNSLPLTRKHLFNSDHSKLRKTSWQTKEDRALLVRHYIQQLAMVWSQLQRHSVKYWLRPYRTAASQVRPQLIHTFPSSVTIHYLHHQGQLLQSKQKFCSNEFARQAQGRASDPIKRTLLTWTQQQEEADLTWTWLPLKLPTKLPSCALSKNFTKSRHQGDTMTDWSIQDQPMVDDPQLPRLLLNKDLAFGSWKPVAV